LSLTYGAVTIVYPIKSISVGGHKGGFVKLANKLREY